MLNNKKELQIFGRENILPQTPSSPSVSGQSLGFPGFPVQRPLVLDMRNVFEPLPATKLFVTQ